MDEYLSREFNQDADQDADQNLRSSIKLPSKGPILIHEPHSPAPNFDTPGSHFIETPFSGPGKLALTATPTDPWAFPPPLVDEASPVATDTDAPYELASYPPSPELHPTNPVMTTVASGSSLEPQPGLSTIQTPVSCWGLAQSTDPEVPSTSSEEQAEQLLQQKVHQHLSTHYQFPMNSPQAQESVFAATTMDQATQTQTPRPATATTAGSTPAPSVSESIPREQPAASVHSIATLPSRQQQPLPPPPIMPFLYQYPAHLPYGMAQ
ncbi:hypothetical protein F4680DRAFT_153931 [Xylaria scruposa]|nr:hypothetical protein F4680DRAFT_153931 [Xylaria scruposa]